VKEARSHGRLNPVALPNYGASIGVFTPKTLITENGHNLISFNPPKATNDPQFHPQLFVHVTQFK
jgi:hypothetical protein